MNNKLSSSLFIALIVSLGGFVFGFDASVISGVVSFVAVEFNLTDWQQGFVVSSPTLGAAIASLVAGTLSDRVGRKKVLLGIAFLYVLSAICSALATSYYMLVSARFIGGLAFASLILAPIYIAEISPAERRGKMISFNQFNIVIGLSAAYFANYFILNLAQSDIAWVTNLGINDNVWRWMLGLEIIPASIFFIALMFVPESPRFLAMNGQREKAKEVLERLHGKVAMQRELAEIDSAPHKREARVIDSVKQLFSKNMRLVLTIGLVVAIAQQITGVNAIYFYAPSIFEQSGVGTNAAFAQAIWVGIINVIFTIVAMVLIDKIGRKPLLVVGLTGVFLSMSLCYYGFSNATYQLTEKNVAQISLPAETLAPVLNQQYNDDLAFKDALKQTLGEKTFKANEAELIQSAINIDSTLVLMGILGFVASFAVSLGPVMWVLLAEIFPNHLRGIAISFVGVVNSGISFTVQLVFPWELSNFGTALTFLIYGLFAVVGLVLVLWLLPETKGKTLEQIEQDLVPA
ncbi:sugar porter family MFS transporter [Thalassotalea aquiviva]|uniref:sugar porter family MFS transporter n=1 Tax=Thalassotalea aquiviva TaxID=3242415 RepID=UPI00352B3BB8